jgi:hypothetical protein
MEKFYCETEALYKRERIIDDFHPCPVQCMFCTLEDRKFKKIERLTKIIDYILAATILLVCFFCVIVFKFPKEISFFVIIVTLLLAMKLSDKNNNPKT